MIWTTLSRTTAALVTATTVLGTGLFAGCGALDVDNPTAIQESELNDATGADLLRDAALSKFIYAFQTAVAETGLMSDELMSDPNPTYEQQGQTPSDRLLDQRRSVDYETFSNVFTSWNAARVAASVALPKVQAYALTANPVGELFALRGFATMALGEQVCPGFPLNQVVNYKAVFGPPLTNEEVLEHAIADFDSAIVYAADSAEILHFAQVGRARALLNLGRFAEAASMAAAVPDGFVHNAIYLGGDGTDVSLRNYKLTQWAENEDLSIGVSDGEGVNGLDFVSAGDPRVVTVEAGTAWDGVTRINEPAMYATYDSPIVLGSGIEARLIQAEAALHAGDPAWRIILNTLRSTQMSSPLDSLVDPGSDTARVSLLFRERAFWLFGTGHRLGDLRRLVRQYGRDAEEVFPTGPYRLGTVYSTATSIPFRAADEIPYSPGVTGCTTR